jgi:hypothetical protein
MRRIVLVMAVCLIAIACSEISWSQQGSLDVVYLKNGSIIKGTIIEQVPNKTIKMQTGDGNIFVYDFKEIEKITKEQPAVQKRMSASPSRKDPTTALVLSCLIPGAGQFYSNQTKKGAIQFGGALVGYLAYFIARPHMGEVWVYDYYSPSYGYWDNQEVGTGAVAYPGLILALGCHIWSIVDAPTTASRYNSTHGFALNEIPLRENLILSIAAIDFKRPLMGPQLAIQYRF